MVVLKSGGPIMTVTHVDKKPILVQTRWFTDRDSAGGHSRSRPQRHRSGDNRNSGG
jgi:uncharacterized protein YodC (DUF2158 family)